MRHLRNVGLAVLVLASTASTVLAQRTVRTSNAPASSGGFWEFGTDFAGMTFGIDNPSNTTFSLGSGVLRAGRYISDVMSVEPQLTFFRTSGGGSSRSDLGLEVGLLYHLQAERTARQMYVRPLIIWNRTASSGSGVASTSNSRTGFGVGGGVKMAAKNPKFTWRGEVAYTHILKDGTIDATNAIMLILGASVYTR